MLKLVILIMQSELIFVFHLSHVCLLLKRGTIAHLHSIDEMGKVGNHGDVTMYMFTLWVCILLGCIRYCSRTGEC